MWKLVHLQPAGAGAGAGVPPAAATRPNTSFAANLGEQFVEFPRTCVPWPAPASITAPCPVTAHGSGVGCHGGEEGRSSKRWRDARRRPRHRLSRVGGHGTPSARSASMLAIFRSDSSRSFARYERSLATDRHILGSAQWAILGRKDP